MPSQVRGFGVSTVENKTPFIVPEQTSVAVGIVGGIASAIHSTVLDPLAPFITGPMVSFMVMI